MKGRKDKFMNIKGDAMTTAHDILIAWAKSDKTTLTKEVKGTLENFLKRVPVTPSGMKKAVGNGG